MCGYTGIGTGDRRAVGGDCGGSARMSKQSSHQEKSREFEEMVGEILTAIGCDWKKIDIDNSERTPDFRVQQGGMACFVEATVVNPMKAREDPNEEKVIADLKSLDLSRFCLDVTLNDEGLSKTLPKREVTTPIQKLMNEYDPLEVQQSVAFGVIDRAPHHSIEHGKWRLDAYLVPSFSDHGKRIRKYSEGVEVCHVGWADGNNRVQEAITRKAKKYKNCDFAPLIVAVEVGATPGINMPEALLLGAQAIVGSTYYRDDGPAIVCRRGEKRILGGVWCDHGGQPHYNHLKAVLAVSPNSRPFVQLYINPLADITHLPESLLRFPLRVWDQGQGRFQMKQSIDAYDWEVLRELYLAKIYEYSSEPGGPA